MTLDDNRRDLAKHHREFVDREAYAYTVLDPDETRCLGCVYLEPWLGHFDAKLALWVTDAALATGLEPFLMASILAWIERAWPFDRVLLRFRPANTPAIEAATALGLSETTRGVEPGHVGFVWLPTPNAPADGSNPPGM